MSEVIHQTTNSYRNKALPLAELRTFLVVWIGQAVSILGSAMTAFALGVYIYQQTGSATGFALTLLFNMLPRAVLAPIAGVVADRYDRRLIMILTDSGAGFATIMTALLLLTGRLEVWHIYLLTALNASFSTLQGPAFGAAVTQLVPKSYFGRANGLLQLGEGIGQIAAPVLAGVLIASIGLWSILLVDMATFFFAVLMLLLIKFPSYQSEKHSPATQSEGESWYRQAWKGWRYLWTRPGLIGLVLVFTATNFFVGIAEAVLTPMILSFASPNQLGVMMTIGGFGLLAGSLLMSGWGGGKRKIFTVFGAYSILGAAVIIAGSAPSIPLVATALFIAFFSAPIVMAGSQSIMQAKVAPDVQGRVFALRMMLNTAAFAVAYALGGPLADKVFEPFMATDGAIANTIGKVIGSGPGRGMGLMFIVVGIFALFTALSAFAYPRLRRVEIELPDMVD